MKRLSLILFLGIVACAPTAATASDSAPISVMKMNYRASLVRMIDEQAGVVCWAIEGGTYEGLSCLPVEETRLGE